MDVERIKQLAINFETIAKGYSVIDEEARLLLVGMQDYVRLAKSGLISESIGFMPGERLFSEGGLAKYYDLELAYSKFVNAITIGDTEDYKELMKSLDTK